MIQNLKLEKITGWLFGLLILSIGILNMILIHPVPGLIYMLLSLIFFPPAIEFLERKTQIILPRVIQIFLGFLIIWFTLGVSDLGEIYGL